VNDTIRSDFMMSNRLLKICTYLILISSCFQGLYFVQCYFAAEVLSPGLFITLGIIVITLVKRSSQSKIKQSVCVAMKL